LNAELNAVSDSYRTAAIPKPPAITLAPTITGALYVTAVVSYADIAPGPPKGGFLPRIMSIILASGLGW